MTESLDSKEAVSIEEIASLTMYDIETSIEVLAGNGIVTIL